MEDMEVLSGVNPDSLTAEKKRKELRAVDPIKLKRRGKFKYRMCANGAPNSKFLPREDTKSPKITLEGLLDNMVIDAYVGRKVATFYVPGAYLQTDLPKDKLVLLLSEGKFVDIMCEINPEYKQQVRTKDGRNTLYIRILKAIYGIIESALL